MKINITTCNAKVILQSIQAVDWECLPLRHVDRIAVEDARKKMLEVLAGHTINKVTGASK